jgi:hypothetical protein
MLKRFVFLVGLLNNENEEGEDAVASLSDTVSLS